MEQNVRFLLDKSFFDSPLSFGDFNLVQIGRRFCLSGSLVAQHVHRKWFELTIITKGRGEIVTNDRTAEVSAGDICLSFPFEIHEIRSDENLEYDFLAFFFDPGETAERFDALPLCARLSESRIIRDERISALLGDAVAEFVTEGDKPMSNELLFGIFTQISVFILRDFGDMKLRENSFSNSEIMCFKIMNYIDTHLYSIKELGSVAEELNYNYSYLSSLFRRTTGSSISDYLHERRMKAAVALLSSAKSVGDVAELLCYQSKFAFSKAFKAKYGRPPSAFKKKRPGQN